MQDFWSFFAFPLNLILAALWAICWGWLWKKRPDLTVVRFLLSPAATISAILLLLAGCLWIGLTGDRSFSETILFVAVLIYVQTVIFLVTLRGWRTVNGHIRWRFVLIHAGLLLAVGSGFWGAPDSSELRVALGKGEETRTAYTMDGGVNRLGYDLKMTDYETEFSDDRKPIHYEALISIDGQSPVSVTVNDPYSVKFGEDIYLASVSEQYCILQIVREPWRYFALSGIIMLLVGAFMLFIKGPRR